MSTHTSIAFNVIEQIQFDDITKQSNMSLILERLFVYYTSKHGLIANILRTMMPHVEPDNHIPKPTGSKELDQLALDRWSKAVDRRDIRAELNNTQCSKLFADIILQLSTFKKTKEHPGYDEANATSDPVRLWRIVVEVHTFNDKRDGAESKLAALDNYYSIRMGATSTIYDFKRVVDTGLQGFALTKQEPPAMDIQVEHFLSRLDPTRYGGLQLALKNRLRKKTRTLADAYVAARDHHVLTRSGGTTSLAAQKSATVLTMTEKKDKKGTADTEKKRRRRWRQKKSHKRRTRVDHLLSIVTSAEGDLKKAEDRRHWTGDCPRLATIKVSNKS